MATKIYVIGIEIDTDYQSFGDVEEALDELDIDYELREEYTMYADTCDICGAEIEEGGSHYRFDENEHICEDCYQEWLSGKPSAEAYRRAKEELIKVAEGKGWTQNEISAEDTFFPYGMKLVGFFDDEHTKEIGTHVLNVKDYENV